MENFEWTEMKTVLLLTKSAETQRLIGEILDPDTHFVLFDPLSEPTREQFDTLLSKWSHLADAVILDAVSLGEPSRWALESLDAMPLQNHQAVVVRATALQQTLYPLAQGWLVVSDMDSPEELRRSLRTFFELRDTRVRLKHAQAVIASQRQAAVAWGSPVSRSSTAPGSSLSMASPGSSFDSYRFAEALKSISRVVGQRHNQEKLLSEFLRLVRKLLGVGKLAIFMRRFETDLFGRQPAPTGNQLSVAASEGIEQEVVEHLRLTRDAGIGGYLAREARILRRTRLADPLGSEDDTQVASEFALFGAEVAVPIFDNGQLLGVLILSGKITGDPITNEELELVYYLMTELAQAIRNLHLLDQIAGQQRFMSEVLANVQSGVVAIGQDGRILSLNNRARQLLEVGNQEIIGQKINRLPSRVGDMLFEVLQTGNEICQREVILPRVNRPLAISATRFAPSVLSGFTTRFGSFGSAEGGLEGETADYVVVALIEDLTQAKLQQAQTRAVAEKEFFTRLASRLSHELKNALVSIKIFAQLLPERYNEAEFRGQFSNIVANEVNRVDLLINNLTFFAHPLELVYEELILTDWVEACLQNAAQEFARKHLALLSGSGEKPSEAEPEIPLVTVKKNFEHKTPRLQGDKIRLIQALEHLLRNAVEAMPKGGRLVISTADAPPSDFPDGKLPMGGVLRIECLDTGEGIGLDNLKRVVEPFVTTRNVGVGLGLTIVKKIIEQHGGRLEVDSVLGRGTTVTLWLPVRAQPQSQQPSSGERSTAVACPAGLPISKDHVDEKQEISQNAADRLSEVGDRHGPGDIHVNPV